MNLATPERGFPNSEYEHRTRRVQKKMAEDNISAILLTTEPEIRYFSGFFTQFWQSPTRPWFLIIPEIGKPIAIIPEIGAARMNYLIALPNLLIKEEKLACQWDMKPI